MVICLKIANKSKMAKVELFVLSVKHARAANACASGLYIFNDTQDVKTLAN
jgi:hypothetical protein